MTKAVGDDIMVQPALPAVFPDDPAGTATDIGKQESEHLSFLPVKPALCGTQPQKADCFFRGFAV